MRRHWMWLLAVPMSLHAQSTTKVVALVAAARDSSPIADAEVVFMDSHRRVVTNWMGEALFDRVARGTHRVRVRKVGFGPVDVDLLFTGDSMAPVFLLAPSVVSLDTIRVLAPSVRAHLREFEGRRQLGIGHFLTRSQLDAEGNREFALVASTRFPGLQARTDVGGKYHLVSTRSACGASPGVDEIMPKPPQAGSNGPIRSQTGDAKAAMFSSCSSDVCPLKIFLDGIILQQDDFDIVHPWDLAAVEYYTGANMPPQYRIPGSACGVMLLWSR